MDLNLFICDEGCQVFWDDRSCANANLDVDDRDGGGPETITLNSQMPAPLDQTYVAWVCNFIIFFLLYFNDKSVYNPLSKGSHLY